MSSDVAVFMRDSLAVHVHSTSAAAGSAAAHMVAQRVNAAVSSNGICRLVLATGASQFDMLETLKTLPVNWDLVHVFHLDEYVGIPADHRASFRNYLRSRILNDVEPGVAHFLEGDAADPQSECRRYEILLRSGPIDVLCAGIGENGHLAFNEPGDANPADERWVRIVDLADESRRQQVGEGWFDDLSVVPDRALTMTVTAILSAESIVCTVPDSRKASAVRQSLMGKVGEECPASFLRRHGGAFLFLDRDSSSDIAQLVDRSRGE